MTKPIRNAFWLLAVVGISLTDSAFATPKKTAAKPKAAARPAAKPPTAPKPGIKLTPQMNGWVGRFGDLYALKTGWTFQILSARISYDPFDDYSGLYPDAGQKLLVLNVAIKNNTGQDLFFDSSAHQFQVVDTNNQLYEGGNYRLASGKNQEFSPNLKPGQGAGQDLNNPLQVAIPIGEEAQVAKIILKEGRKGTNEDVIRFPLPGALDGNERNVVAPAVGEDLKAVLKPGQVVPSRYFTYSVAGVTFVPGPVKEVEAPENRRFAVVTLKVKNVVSKSVSAYEFLAGAYDQMYFTDADGENYPASADIGLLKASSDEASEGDYQEGQEKTVRVAFAVPNTGELKTLTLSAQGGKKWTFDASGWK